MKEQVSPSRKFLHHIIFKKQAQNSSLSQFWEQAQPDPKEGCPVNSAGTMLPMGSSQRLVSTSLKINSSSGLL